MTTPSRATIIGTHTRLLHAPQINDTYELSVWLPDSYHTTNQQYPVLYLLDAPTMFGAAVSAALFQHWDAAVDVPEMIIVGVGKQMQSLAEWWPIRERDYVPIAPSNNPNGGQAAEFLTFFEQTLLPFVDAHYRTQPDERLLWGVSMGGVFTLYALFNKPHLFNCYLSTCPSFVVDDKTVFDYAAALATAAFHAPIRLFVSTGELDHEYAPNTQAFVAALEQHRPPNLYLDSMVLAGLGHTPAAIPSLIYGLEAVYTPIPSENNS